jgi:hypothetical protein
LSNHFLIFFCLIIKNGLDFPLLIGYAYKLCVFFFEKMYRFLMKSFAAVKIIRGSCVIMRVYKCNLFEGSLPWD